MPDDKSAEKLEPHEETGEAPSTPWGAVIITTLLLLTIGVMWFGMYLLNLVRS